MNPRSQNRDLGHPGYRCSGELDKEFADLAAATRRLRDFDADRSSGDGFEQGLIVGRGTIAIRIVRRRRPLGTPSADTSSLRVNECHLIAHATAVFCADDVSHQLNQLVSAACAFLDQLLAEFQSPATGASALLHQFDDGIAIERGFFFLNEVR